eukprot:TRINITY_DN79923_c0_g1_i1.p1 TRINITY_DN79923_c0_g1~~TRINITY_DN79923_c0_g1_i1.p1  ORF type:complete len:181 (-),score=21.19 TRINITY_DN79923_c0_g1_i1:302-844(-)
MKRNGITIDEVFPSVGCIAKSLQGTMSKLAGFAQVPEHANQKWLLHGTSYENAHEIVTTGFDSRICRSGMYGKGTYFASQSCKIHQYTCKIHPQKACECKHERTMIVARVALGDPFYASSADATLRRPPARQKEWRRHDSIIANVGTMKGHKRGFQDHQEFVIFNGAQAYPSFVVQYDVC